MLLAVNNYLKLLELQLSYMLLDDGLSECWLLVTVVMFIMQLIVPLACSQSLSRALGKF